MEDERIDKLWNFGDPAANIPGGVDGAVQAAVRAARAVRVAAASVAGLVAGAGDVAAVGVPADAAIRKTCDVGATPCATSWRRPRG